MSSIYGKMTSRQKIKTLDITLPKTNVRILNNPNDKLKQLQWQCRRGMLEIDLLLNRYLSAHYPHISVDEQATFEALLSENDQNLFLWLTGRSPAPEKYQSILERLHS